MWHCTESCKLGFQEKASKPHHTFQQLEITFKPTPVVERIIWFFLWMMVQRFFASWFMTNHLPTRFFLELFFALKIRLCFESPVVPWLSANAVAKRGSMREYLPSQEALYDHSNKQRIRKHPKARPLFCWKRKVEVLAWKNASSGSKKSFFQKKMDWLVFWFH